MKLENTQLFFLVIKLTKPLAVSKVPHLFVLIITLMLSKIFNEALVLVSNQHNYKTFTKSPPASLLHCIETILNHSYGKCRDSLKMAALSSTMSTGICAIFVH